MRRAASYKIILPNKEKAPAKWKPDKTDKPDPGSYLVEKKDYMLRTRSPTAKIGTGKRSFFTETAGIRKKFIPGAGTYNVIESKTLFKPMRDTRFRK